jgi:hypothetical protein
MLTNLANILRNRPAHLIQPGYGLGCAGGSPGALAALSLQAAAPAEQATPLREQQAVLRSTAHCLDPLGSHSPQIHSLKAEINLGKIQRYVPYRINLKSKHYR